MIDELWAIRGRIDGLPDLSAWVGRAPEGAAFPYVTLSAPGWDNPDDLPVCGPGDHLSADVRVKVADTTESNVHVRLKAIRDELTPGMRVTSLEVAGRVASLQFVRSEFVTSDPDVTYGTTNHKAGFGVDTYRVDSQPA